MKNQRVLDNTQVNWFSDESMRLNYQMIFNERALEEPDEEESQDLAEVLAERDNRWKNKLKIVKEEAFQKGYDEGFEQGRVEAAQEIDRKLSGIKEALIQAQEAWTQQQKMLEPGVLDMAFDIAESILGIPVENPDIRQQLETNLGQLLQKVDESARPMLWISDSDFEYVNKLKEEYAPNTPINIKTDTQINPGEFRLETNNETVIQNFKGMMADFRQTLSLPTWK